MVSHRNEMVCFLFFAIFFWGSLSTSSFFHNQDYARIAVQALILVSVILVVVLSYRKIVFGFVVSLPLFIVMALVGFSGMLFHFYMLFLISLAFLSLVDDGFFSKASVYAWAGVTLGVVLVIVGAYFGFLENKLFYVSTSSTTKESLGFFNPNIGGILAASIFILGLCSRRNDIIFVSFLLFFFVFSKTFSRASIGLVAVFIFYVLVVRNFPYVLKKVLLFGFGLVGLFVAFAVYWEGVEPYIFDLRYSRFADVLLSHRISIALPYVQGKELLLPSVAETNLDFSWVNLLLSFGFISICFYFLLFAISIFLVDRGKIDLILGSVMIGFFSLFVENIGYIYIPLGVCLLLPLAFISYSLDRGLGKIVVSKA